MRNILEEIETKYPVADVRVGGEQVWPYLRNRYAESYVAKISAESGERQAYASLKSRRLKAVAASLYGARNWFRKYRYVALSAAGYRREVNGKQFNRFVDPIIDNLGRDAVLLIERHTTVCYPKAQVHTANIASEGAPLLLAWILHNAMRRPSIENASVLKAIQEEYGLELSYGQLVRAFEAERRVFAFLLRKIQPRAVLLTCYYGREGFIKAAHDLGIKVIEVQHGVIGKGHPAYNVYSDLDKSFFPDDLLVYGKKELDTFDDARFIDPAHVHPVGSFYIDYVKSTFVPDPDLVHHLARYQRSVGVTLQLGRERRLIDFICRAAHRDTTICHVLIPRAYDSYLSDLDLPENVMILEKQNFYEAMMYVDFHSTIFSTCAIEAPALGVQNILLNIDNLSRRYYETSLTDSRITRYVDTVEEYIETIQTFPKLDRETVSRSNEAIIATGYQDNIRRFIRSHLS